VSEDNDFTILLVEDEAADACLVRLALRDAENSSQLHHVSDGAEALAFVQRREDRYAGVPRPKLILLDLNMPRMNGREFLRHFRGDTTNNDIPVVVFSTSEYERDKESCFALGANDFVTKPVDIDEFIAAVKGIETRWMLANTKQDSQP
jgi:CheY-like chemotaxis protein